jgi:hypothetical protein
MTQVEILDDARDPRNGSYKVDVNRGERIGRVSSEWFSRPGDERYLSLSELFVAVRSRAERSRTRTAESAAIRVKANRDNFERLAMPGEDVPLVPKGAVRASDKRAEFVGIEAYQAAGGTIMRDLFQQDNGGWLQDPVLLDRLVANKLEREAKGVRREGWKWVELAIDFPFGHTYGLRHISGEPVAMSEKEAATAEALRAEYDRLERTHLDADELPEDVDQRLGEIETALAVLDERPVKYDPQEMARAGVFVSICGTGALRVERGYVRPEDEAAAPKSSPESDIESGTVEAASMEGPEAELSRSVVQEGA